MKPEQIEQGGVYLSIHGVPYRVTSLSDSIVEAQCENGRTSTTFEMSLARFAQSMDRPHSQETVK